MRPIRSYVLRQGRLTAAQAHAHAELLPRLGVRYSPKHSDLDRMFGRAAPKIVEIGFGMGDTTAQIAAANPELDYLGIEVHTPGVGAVLKRIAELKLANVRIIQHDAVEVFEHMIAPETLAGVHIFFPDPWPKKRHHKRRMVQPEFAGLAGAKLKEGGILHAATDWPEYAEHMHEVFSREPLLEPAPAGFTARPVTKFESRGRRLGHPVRDLVFRRRGKAPAAR